MASARSVLQVERRKDDTAIRVVHHIKSSAVPSGPDFSFELRPDTGFRWLEIGASSNADDESVADLPTNKHELAAYLITKALKNGPVDSGDIRKIMVEHRIGEKTMNDAKNALGIKPYRKMRRWYWEMPDIEAKDVRHE